MRILPVIAAQELRALFRERVFTILLIIFVAMTLVSSTLGFLATHTTTAIYDASTHFLTEKGVQNIPINPLLSLPPLTGFRNITVYMFLVGSLLAVVIGHRSFIRERKAGVLPIMLSRPFSLGKIFAGKIIGMSIGLLFILGMTFCVSLATSFMLPFGSLSVDDVLRLAIFYGTTFIYLMIFVFLGLMFAVKTRSESLALFIPVCIWIGLSFFLPELISGQNPTALLNPIAMNQAPDLVNPFFIFMKTFVQPFSLGGQYTEFSSQLLKSSWQGAPLTIFEVLSSHVFFFAKLLASIACLGYASFFVLKRTSILETEVYE